MKPIGLLFILLHCATSFGQAKMDYSSIDSQISKIPPSATNSTAAIANYIASKYSSPDEKIRAVFYWTAANINYDVANKLALQQEQTLEERIAKTLQSRKGVCKNYAEVFNDLANKLAIKTVIIRGYTKQFGAVGNIPHAWCASKIGNKWYLFDPTWSAGYVDHGRFKKRIKDRYYKVQPEEMIATHMPYDYLWQFLSSPLNNTEFTTGKLVSTSAKIYFDFEQEIAKQETQTEEQQLIASSARIRENGITNAMIAEVLTYNANKVSYLREQQSLQNLNVIFKKYHEGVTELNQFIAYKNKQFKPVKKDVVLKNMILSPYDKLLWCQKTLGSIGMLSEANRDAVIRLENSLKAAIQMTSEHKNFVFQYVNKPPNSREKMFYKRVY